MLILLGDSQDFSRLHFALQAMFAGGMRAVSTTNSILFEVLEGLHSLELIQLQGIPHEAGCGDSDDSGTNMKVALKWTNREVLSQLKKRLSVRSRLLIQNEYLKVMSAVLKEVDMNRSEYKELAIELMCLVPSWTDKRNTDVIDCGLSRFEAAAVRVTSSAHTHACHVSLVGGDTLYLFKFDIDEKEGVGKKKVAK